MQQWEYRAVNIHTRYDLVTYETVMSCGQAIKIEDSHADDSSKAAEGARALHYHICYLNHLGQEGWELIQEQKPDLVVTDCQMPRLDGFGLVARIRQNEETASLPVLMLTAKGFEIDQQEAADTWNVREVIAKPFSPRELLQKVEAALAEMAANAE